MMLTRKKPSLKVTSLEYIVCSQLKDQTSYERV
jgi:hypothetical protein